MAVVTVSPTSLPLSLALCLPVHTLKMMCDGPVRAGAGGPSGVLCAACLQALRFLKPPFFRRTGTSSSLDYRLLFSYFSVFGRRNWSTEGPQLACTSSSITAWNITLPDRAPSLSSSIFYLQKGKERLANKLQQPARS